MTMRSINQQFADPTGRTASYVIAASNATATEKAQADVVCTGTADNTIWQAAITTGYSNISGTSGTYNFSTTVTGFSNNQIIDSNEATFNYNGASPLFNVGTANGVIFNNINTDAGGITNIIGSYTVNHCNLGSVYYPVSTQIIPNIIDDTDIGGDIDDALAIAELNIFENEGKVNLLGFAFCHNDNYPDAGACDIQAINDYYGHPNIPIGANHESIQGNYLTVDGNVYSQYLASNFPNQLSTTKNAPDAVTLYRQILANQPNNSVTIVTHGPLTNIYNLYNSPADSISPLTGSQLMLAKVKTIVCQGGDYPSMSGGPQGNFGGDPASCAVINSLANTSIQIYFSGQTLGLSTLVSVANMATNNPVYLAFMRHHEYVGEAYGTVTTWYSWDPLTALFAVVGSSYQGTAYFNISAAGINTINTTNGNNSFSSASGGNMYYLTNAVSYANLATALSAIVCTPPNYVSASTWWNQSYGYRKTVTLNTTSITSTLSDFTILVQLNSGNFDFTKAQANGQDIRFISSDGVTPLAYEIDTWNQGAQTANIWVRIPSLIGNSTTQYIYMYYGNKNATDGQSVNYAFNQNYIFVSHMNDSVDTSHTYDSSNPPLNSVVAAKQGAANPAVTTSGEIGNAQNFNGSTSYIAATASSKFNLTTLTMSAWIYIPSIPASGYRDVIEHDGVYDNDWYGIFYNSDSNRINVRFNATDHPNATVVVGATQWYYVVGTFNNTTKAWAIYINGALDSSGTGTGTSSFDPNSVLDIGARSEVPSQYFSGYIDEVQVSNVVRSADWEKMEYVNVTGSILTFGAVQNNPYAQPF